MHMYNSGSLVDYECEIPECPPLNLRHGRRTCTGFQDGDTCDVTCNRGSVKCI